jgi:hypothetical protein
MTGYTLIGIDGLPHEAHEPGTLGGHRRAKIYGRLDCPSALRAIAKGGYVQHGPTTAEIDVRASTTRSFAP